MINIKVDGLDAIGRNLKQYSKEIEKYMAQAGQQSATELLKIEGLQKYPPATEANQEGRTKQVTFANGRTATFRMGYYIRGRGAFAPTRGGGWVMTNKSERLGTQWYVRKIRYGVRIGNRASYAHFVHGEDQAGAMGNIGWKQLALTAEENQRRITEIYQMWIYKLIGDLDLR